MLRFSHLLLLLVFCSKAMFAADQGETEVKGASFSNSSKALERHDVAAIEALVSPRRSSS